MTNKEIKAWCKGLDIADGFIIFPEETFEALRPEQAEIIVKYFSGTTLMLLPEKEIRFFKWLKDKDRVVWDDLWDAPDEEPYLVAISFLPILLENDGRGFPICDLQRNDNYYFSIAHMVDKESMMLIDSSKERMLSNKTLTAAQLLALEISMSPIDIWHFAYKHNIGLETAKAAAFQLVEDEALVHLTEADHIARFIEF